MGEDDPTAEFAAGTAPENMIRQPPLLRGDRRSGKPQPLPNKRLEKSAIGTPPFWHPSPDSDATLPDALVTRCGEPLEPIGSSRPLGATLPVVAIGSTTDGVDEAPDRTPWD